MIDLNVKKGEFVMVGIILIIIVLAIIYLVVAQRSFVSLEEMCSNSLSQIGVQQQSRWDALTELAKATKSYSQHEYETLMQVVAQRNGTKSGNNAAEMQQNDKQFSNALSQFQFVAEQYPALRASEVYQTTMDAINSYEDKVRKGRMVYNDTVTKYNRKVKQFPSSIVASIFNFNVKPYYEGDEMKSGMPDLKF